MQLYWCKSNPVSKDKILNIMTTEQQVASTILEKPIATLELDGENYEIAAPCTSTLILVSEIISTLPVVEKCASEQVLASVLHNAKDYTKLGDIVAVLILGRKRLTEEREIVVEETVPCLFGLLKRKRKVTRKVVVDRKAELSQKVLDSLSPSELQELLVERLSTMEIGDFFAITTSLSEANLLKPTREVD